MVLGILLTPLWWLWYTTLYVYSHSWALGVCIVIVSSLYLVYRHRLTNSSLLQQTTSRPKVAKMVTKHAILVKEVEQVLPAHPHNGWSLYSVCHGLRVFSRFFPSLGVVSDTPCLAATTVINISPKKLVSISTNGVDIPCWVEGVSMVPQYIQQSGGTSHSDADIIQITFKRSVISQRNAVQKMMDCLRMLATHFTQKYATFLDGFISIPTQFNAETFIREWSIDGGGRGQVCWVARKPSQLPYHWSMLSFYPSVKEKNQSIVTLVMLPNSPEKRTLTSTLLTSQLTALKDFSSLRRARVYSHSSLSSHSNSAGAGHMTSHDSHDGDHHQHSSGHSSSRSGRGSPAVPATIQQKNNSLGQGTNTVWETNGPLSTAPSNPTSVASSQQQRQSRHTSDSSPALPFTPPHISPLLTTNHTHTPSNTITITTPTLTARYTELGRESCNILVCAAEATEEDGWTVIGNTKNVFIMKRVPQKGDVSVNCIKGTGIIRAPPQFVFRIVRNTENNSKLDDMLKETRLVDRVTPTTVLVHLLFKAVWPTTPRDFTVISTAGRYDDETFIEAGISVVDPRIPEEKGYVRGNIICGGYVIKVCPGMPEQCEVTYVSQAELKGSIPNFAVNKVTESQPLCIARLRVLAEEQYAALKNDSQKMKEFEESVILSPIHPPSSTQPLPQISPSTTDRGDTVASLEDEIPSVRDEEDNEKSSKENGEQVYSASWSVVDNVSHPESHLVESGNGEERQEGDGMLVMEALRTYTPDAITSDEGEEEEDGGERVNEKAKAEVERIRFEKKLQPYPISPSALSTAETESLTEDSISFPRQESGCVDFRTLGNQTAARVLEELFHVSSLDIANPSLFDNGSSGWKVIDNEKNVVILKKKTPGTPFYSFMGRGVIDLPPRHVYDSVRNPQLRYTYDNMLKELHSVKHIEDGLYVLHVHHETTQCFIKQSRDFCILANEREEGNKLLLVGLSVDIPECPVNPNVTRAKITYSGWVIEPHIVNRKTSSMVTYLLQVDLGGVPATLVNYISRRQPLAIAYLRDYLISTQTSSLRS